MQRISLAWFADWGRKFEPLVTVGGLDGTDGIQKLYAVRPYLEALAQEGNALSLRASRPAIAELLAHIDWVLGDPNEQLKRLDAHKLQLLQFGFRLNAILDAELAVQPTYHVWPKRAYDTDILATNATRLFSEATRTQFTEEETFNIEESR
jgi:hypothetical protein